MGGASDVLGTLWGMCLAIAGLVLYLTERLTGATIIALWSLFFAPAVIAGAAFVFYASRERWFRSRLVPMRLLARYCQSGDIFLLLRATGNPYADSEMLGVAARRVNWECDSSHTVSQLQRQVVTHPNVSDDVLAVAASRATDQHILALVVAHHAASEVTLATAALRMDGSASRGQRFPGVHY